MVASVNTEQNEKRLRQAKILRELLNFFASNILYIGAASLAVWAATNYFSQLIMPWIWYFVGAVNLLYLIAWFCAAVWFARVTKVIAENGEPSRH